MVLTQMNPSHFNKPCNKIEPGQTGGCWLRVSGNWEMLQSLYLKAFLLENGAKHD